MNIRKILRKTLLFAVAIFLLHLVAVSQEKKPANNGIKKKLEKIKDDPKTKENAAKADVYIVRSGRKITK